MNRAELVEHVATRPTDGTWQFADFVDDLVYGQCEGMDRTEVNGIVRDGLAQRRGVAADQPAEKQDSLYIVKSITVPVRPEDWIESEDHPGFWVNSTGEVMDGKGKVRKIFTSFNPKTRKWSVRVWLGQLTGYEYHNNMLIERQKIVTRNKAGRLT